MADDVIERLQREAQQRTGSASGHSSASHIQTKKAQEFLDIYAGGKVTSFFYSSLSLVEMAEDQAELVLEFFCAPPRKVTVKGALLGGLRDRVKTKVEEAIRLSPRSAADIKDMPVVLEVTVKEA